ncbi:trypsin-7-like [Centruroides vittatus]|uniref:trypsin-7-like n=1 Tax=Centruroides vittatus TaxID=120091 RepID=UPI00350F752A
MSKERHFLRSLKRLQIILVFVLILFTDAYEQKAVSEISKRIVGGFLANINDYPFMVAIFYIKASGVTLPYFQGSFSLITTKTVLGAAHVTYNATAENLFGKIGNSNKFMGKLIFFSKKIEHPKYNHKKFKYDIVLLILKNDVSDLCLTNPKPVPIALPLSQKENTINNAIIVGWGDMEYKYTNYEYCLRAAYTDVIDPRDLTIDKEPYDGSVILTKKHGVSTMHGDSGGPLIYEDKNGCKVQFGVIGAGTLEAGGLNLFMSTSYFSNFIKENSEGELTYENM